MTNGEMQTLLIVMRHREAVAEKLEELADELRRRARRHDRSKLESLELEGYAEMSSLRSAHPFGSAEYRARREEAERNGCIGRHYDRESHHPEHHERKGTEMGWLDIIEMVIDWHAAAATYNTPGQSLDINENRMQYGSRLSGSQWWLIEQVATWLSDE